VILSDVRVVTAGLFDPNDEGRESAGTFSMVRYDRI